MNKAIYGLGKRVVSYLPPHRRELLKGLLSNVPYLRTRLRGSGGSVSARYCYSVWLRHLVSAHRAGLPVNPRVVAELGPGESLGIGLAALLTGAEEYRAFDVMRYASTEHNVTVFEELIDLVRRRERIPDDDELPRVQPRLESYDFPQEILTGERCERALDAPRLDEIRRAVRAPGTSTKDGRVLIGYSVPWDDPSIIEERSVDMMISQAVLEHVDDIRKTHQALFRWLRPGGFASHEIAFNCHGTAKEWNGHWAYSDLWWKIIRGQRPYLINREPLSRHVEEAERAGFQTRTLTRNTDTSGISRQELVAKFQFVTDEDLITKQAFWQVVRPE